MNSRYFFASALAILSFALQAQPKPQAEQSDPEAKKVLDKVRAKYESYKTLEATFSMTVEVPGKPKDVMNGKIGQQDNKFRFEMDQQTIVSDGKTTWVYLKKNNEVQINDADPADAENGFITPKDLLKRYQKGDFLYAITDKVTENGVLLTQIEFKPKDRNSEYSKLRVSINEKTQAIESVKAFYKDGTRVTFKILQLTPNKALPASYFSFDTKKYPGVKVEDLRL